MISFADLHCDTLYECFCKKVDLTDRTLHIHWDVMNGFKRYIQVFAHYIPEAQPNKWDFLLEFLENSEQILHKQGIALFNHSMKAESKICALLSIEGGDLFSNEEQAEQRIEYLANRGISLFSLIYNHTNPLGCGAHSTIDTGLTTLGAHVVHTLEEHGIFPDVSHASVRSTEDILDIAKGPVCATHSNAFAITPHARNLSDRHLKRIALTDGLIGVNLYPPFLSNRRATIEDVLDHIKYLVNICGCDHVAFGCDFDGIDCTPNEIENISSMELLYKKMKKSGFGEELLEKLFYKNIYEFLKTYYRR